MEANIPAKHAEIIALLESGLSKPEAALRSGMSQGHIGRLAALYQPDSPALREGFAKRRAERNARARENIVALNAVRVPAWVQRADLVSDFRDHARDFGEFAAARHCRRLLAEVRRSA